MRPRRMSVYMRMWTASVLVLSCILWFEISEWAEARAAKLSLTYSLQDRLHTTHSLMLRTHRYDLQPHRSDPVTAIVLPMLAHTSVQQTMYLINSLAFFSPDTSLRFYIGAGSDKDGKEIFDIFHNQTLSDNSDADFNYLTEKYVEVVVLRIPRGENSRNRLHTLMGKAWTEQNDFLVVIHASCVVQSAWTLSAIKQGGIGYSMVPVSDSQNTLHDFEKRVAHNFENLHIGIIKSKPFWCKGSIVQALHLSG
jgi:RimJ/RimL family protein N-acetyltransferase